MNISYDSVIAIISIAPFLWLFIICSRLKQALKKLKKDFDQLVKENTELKNKNTILSNRTPSDEMKEFLLDFKTHGYSFLRVDPDSVFYRSSK